MVILNESGQCAGVVILSEIMKHSRGGSSELHKTVLKQCKIEQKNMKSYIGRFEGL